ncbi:MAG: desulfoferrodoxin [Clostridia bacterium]|nr:desulfoferrodoxin [Clostridia bacterium]
MKIERIGEDNVSELKVYKCTICGTTVEILNGNGSSLTCCGQNMVELKANTADAAAEKHVPVIEKEGDKILVKVGEVPHPMDPDHYIVWIAMVSDEKVVKVNLKPGDKPEATFCYVPGATVYAYCNKHNLWKKDVE